LFYTQAEVNGWQTATGQNISNVQLIKTSGQISLVTPGNPAGAGAVVVGLPSISTLGTNTGLTYNFTTGFSGFGAGVVGAVLPIDLLNFEGQLRNERVSLGWSTSSEENSMQFDIERSYDGMQFIKVSSIAAQGNSSVVTHYSFSDPDDAHENNYYRLRQIDLDGKYEFSKVILLTKAAGKIFKVLNNPFTNYVDVQLGKPANGNTYIRLLDVTGKELLHSIKQPTGLNTMRIDLSQQNIVAGIYLLELVFNNAKHIERIVKQ